MNRHDWMKCSPLRLCVLVCAWCLIVLPLAATAQAPSVRSFEPGSFSRIVSSHKGQPFVVLIWSLDCAYCAESLRTLAQVRQDKKLEIITIATDPAGDPETVRLMAKKLESAGLANLAADKTWAFGNAPEEQLRHAIDPKWRGELPRSYWFNARGEAVPYSGAINTATAARLMQR